LRANTVLAILAIKASNGVVKGRNYICENRN
jgi:hypothetical protein